MPVLSQYTYVFAITVIFAFLDAWNIGANDVANSFATSISSRCLTMKQAVLIASVTEFAGSVAVGSRVTDTLRERVIDPQLYAAQPAVLLLAMMCTAVGSGVFLTIATRYGLPVSTTHSTIGGMVGAAAASVGIGKVDWGVDGVSHVFLAWVIAPGVSGVLGAGLFLVTKYAVLSRTGAVRIALWSIPIYTFITVGALTMLVVWKGIHVIEDPSAAFMITLVFSIAGGAALIAILFVLPYLWRRIMAEDWPLKWYMAWRGPFLLRRPPPPPAPPGATNTLNVRNYYHDHLTPEELAYVRASEMLLQSVQTSDNLPTFLDKDDDFALPPPAQSSSPSPPSSSHVRTAQPNELAPPRPPGRWHSPRVLLWKLGRVLLRGVEQDVVRLQKTNSVLSWDIADMHSRAARFDNRAEGAYASLQVLTAAAASFVHGANDVSNSVAPLATAYEVWMEGEVAMEFGVPLWILCVGGGAIVLGLVTYGYHVMRNLGNRLTLISPSRGFCMELATAITVLMATKLQLPVSCIAGATVGVGLANGDWRCINPRLVAFIYFGWLVTLPATALISGVLMAVIINAPSWATDVPAV